VTDQREKKAKIMLLNGSEYPVSQATAASVLEQLNDPSTPLIEFLTREDGGYVLHALKSAMVGVLMHDEDSG